MKKNVNNAEIVIFNMNTLYEHIKAYVEGGYTSDLEIKLNKFSEACESYKNDYANYVEDSISLIDKKVWDDLLNKVETLLAELEETKKAIVG
ncbi:MAG: hypothetical protein MJ152_01840 [Clostridia bacterium]|nr:hypothetical protein [Clostridia bacterium]